MLGTTRGRKLDQYFPEYVVFDLETTGISCRNDRVVEISAVKTEAGKIVGEYSTLVNPGISIPHEASRVNGITDDMVEDAPDFAQVMVDFLDFAGDYVLVGHNIHGFDMKFIYRDFEACFGKVPDNDYVDTLILARACLPSLSHHKLTNLADYYGISTYGAHRALNDCRMNQMVYEKLGEELKNKRNSIKLCPKCGQILCQRNGKYGAFWGCSGYPGCRYTENA
ncbi:MAG: topoisomerase DNA-binding C4 zinc finger domain-containing protein [Lachnospiraceae bacterium]|nr:topoisomerase DNA-binding C4 zinc finger domain-containing protein [Lachnospiraceae bacterium]